MDASQPRKHARLNPSQPRSATAPREVTLLLSQLEQVARQIGHSEAAQEALAARIADLEMRLGRLEGRPRGVPAAILSQAPLYPAERVTPDTGVPLTALLDELEQRGR